MMPPMLTIPWKKLIIGTATVALLGAGCACKGAPAATTAGTPAAGTEPAAGTPAGGHHEHMGEHGEHGEHVGEHGEHVGEHGEHMGEHPPMPASMTAFHDVLAPLWHAAEGAQRTADTCNAITELINRARAMLTDPAPAGVDGNTWGNAAIKLEGAVKNLHAECGTAARTSFPAMFTGVHDAFHAMLELLPHAP
mgnify:CR=1 FL=1